MTVATRSGSVRSVGLVPVSWSLDSTGTNPEDSASGVGPEVGPLVESVMSHRNQVKVAMEDGHIVRYRVTLSARGRLPYLSRS